MFRYSLWSVCERINQFRFELWLFCRIYTWSRSGHSKSIKLHLINVRVRARETVEALTNHNDVVLS